MLAEQIDAPRDATVLSNFSVEDLDLDSVNSYRQIFSSRAPTHPFIAQSLPDFLRSIQAWKKDRESGEEGLTLAGLLMFGRLNAILDAVPNYIVDYQERPEARTEARWIDRVTTDGSWSGNLFDFYRRVIAKLTADLKAPFRLEAMVRQGVTPVHEALQEALVNALIHADFSGRVSVLVVKRPDMYGFRNPGLMRVPIEQVIRGGDSDCRNRLIQKMFQLVGAGDQAGSGVPRIFGVWKDQSWRLQVVHEKRDPDQTLFERRMASLLPAAVVADLENSYGERFLSLDATEKLVVVTAAVEGFVDHKRVREITDEHPADITKTLSKLSRDGYLNQSGHGRGTIYRSAGYVEEGTDLLTGPFGTPAGVDPSPRSLPEVQGASTSAKPAKPLDLRSGGSEVRSGGSKGRSGGFVETTGAAQRAEEALSRLFPAGLPSKMAPENMRLLILDVLSEAALSIKELSSLLNRAPDFLRAQHVRPLVAEGLLESEFPDRPNHPAQRYRTKRSAAT